MRKKLERKVSCNYPFISFHPAWFHPACGYIQQRIIQFYPFLAAKTRLEMLCSLSIFSFVFWANDQRPRRDLISGEKLNFKSLVELPFKIFPYI
jgi:hypothetical protein